MPKTFDREQLLRAFDEIGRAAVEAGVKLEIAVYGGSALILESNFRYGTEDVDVARVGRPWPEWLASTVDRIALRNNWAANWFNDAVEFHLSPLADAAADHVEFGTFPRDETPPGLVVHVPTAAYLLALKLKAMRINDPAKGPDETQDILSLMRIVGCETPEEAIAVMGRYFPASAAGAEKQRFLLKQILGTEGRSDAPEYPGRGT